MVVKLAVAGCLFVAGMVGLVTWMVSYVGRGRLILYRAPRPPAPEAAPAGEVHYHTHYEDHTHHHYDERQLHVHAPAAAEPVPAVEAGMVRRAIAPRVVAGEVVVPARDDERIRR